MTSNHDLPLFVRRSKTSIAKTVIPEVKLPRRQSPHSEGLSERMERASQAYSRPRPKRQPKQRTT